MNQNNGPFSWPGMTIWRGQTRTAFVSPDYETEPFDRAVLSWNGTGPAMFYLNVNGQRHCMGEWSATPRSRSGGNVATDTLVLKERATRFHLEAVPASGSCVTLLAAACWKDGQRHEYSAQPSAAWGKILAVPERSQYSEARDAAKICSPTSLAMVLEFYGVNKTTREAADGVFDHSAGIYGNWAFNTAYAHSACSACASFVARARNLADLETEIAAGRPVIISHKWHAGDLTGAPLPHSDGHLLVVRGLTATGDVVVNDPAGQPGAVRRIYPRRDIYRTWLERGCGIAYIIHPMQ